MLQLSNSFVLKLGERIEKASNDFEAEVAATMAAALNN